MEVAELALEKLPPVPLTMLQAPVPIVGVLAASVVLVTPHKLLWSIPALAAVGSLLKVMLTSSLLDAQGALLMVHLKT